MAKASVSGESSKSGSESDNGNSLVLYHIYSSYYSQKVVFALHEKRLKFKNRIVNLYNGEHLEPWFLKLNPNGQVPVLKDGVKIIPDSSRIIDYLEDNFSNGDTPRLKPEKGSTQYQTMERFINMLDKVQVSTITFGCILNPELTGKIKLPNQEVKARSGLFSGSGKMLDDLVVEHKEYTEFYRTKKQSTAKLHAAVKDVNEVKKALDDLGTVLVEIEVELASHNEGKEIQWLCGDKFTIADITLGIILNRVLMLGLWERYFGNSKCPCVSSYFKRIQRRDAFRRSVNQSAGILGTLCCLGTKEKVAVSLGSAMIVLGIAGLAAFLVQRKK